MEYTIGLIKEQIAEIERNIIRHEEELQSLIERQTYIKRRVEMRKENLLELNEVLNNLSATHEALA